MIGYSQKIDIKLKIRDIVGTFCLIQTNGDT